MKNFSEINRALVAKKKIFLFMALCLTTVFAAKAADEIYAVWDENTWSLKLYYDDQRAFRAGITTIYWSNLYNALSVELDVSMKDARPTSTCQWFYNFDKLVAIHHLDYLNTSEVMDMSGMFSGCNALTSLNLSNFNTEKVEDMSAMFRNCISLKSIDLSSFNTSKVTNMRAMFYHCYALESLDLKKFNTAKVTDMSEMFYMCYSLQTLDLSSFNTSNVTDMSDMFIQCKELTSLDLKKFNTEKVTNMRQMFWICTNLTYIDVSNFNTTNVTNMAGMFNYCKSLKSLNLNSFNTSNVTDMSRMFYNCEALESIEIRSFTAPKVTDMSEMFKNCAKLATIYCPNTWKQNSGVMTYSENMFSNCTNLVGGRGTAYDSGKTDKEYARPDASGQKGYFIAETKKIYTAYDSSTKTLTYYCDGLYNSRSGIIEYYEPATVRFANYDTEIEKAVIDPSMQDTLIRKAENMFWGKDDDLINLTEITGLENLNTSKTTNMNYMFAGCRKLKSLDLSNFNTENVVLMIGMFNLCESLTVLDLSSFKINSLTTTEWMFSGCSELIAIINGDDWSGVAHADKMFTACTKLKGGNGFAFDSNYDKATYARPDEGSGKPGYFTSPDMPKKVYTEYDGDTTLTYYYDGLYNVREGTLEDYDPIYQPNANRFSGYIDKIKKVVIDASMKDNELTSGYKMFYGLRQATEIENLHNLNTSNMTDMSEMFYNCRKLTSLDLSSFDTEKVTNMSEMFYVCSKVTSLDISQFSTANVTNMSCMFQGCREMTSLSLGSSFKTNKVTEMYRIFRECSALQSIDLSSFNTEKVTDMTEMFYVCSSLTSLDVSKFDTKNVTSMYCMFAGCKLLTSIDVSHFDTKNVVYMDYMFASCAGLTEIDLSNFNTENVKYMGYMFEKCTSLTSIDLNSFNIGKAESMRMMFNGCAALTTIYCDNDWSTSTVVNDSYDMFWGCYALQGGMGTPYDRDHTKVEYAHPDGGTADPGYFTKKTATAIESVQSSDVRSQKILHDGQIYILRDGKTYNVMGVEVK